MEMRQVSIMHVASLFWSDRDRTRIVFKYDLNNRLFRIPNDP